MRSLPTAHVGLHEWFIHWHIPCPTTSPSLMAPWAKRPKPLPPTGTRTRCISRENSDSQNGFKSSSRRIFARKKHDRLLHISKKNDLPFRLDEITSKHAAVKTGSVKHGMASQDCHNLHLLDNKLRLHRCSMHVAVERCKMCTGHACQNNSIIVNLTQLKLPSPTSVSIIDCCWPKASKKTLWLK